MPLRALTQDGLLGEGTQARKQSPPPPELAIASLSFWTFLALSLIVYNYQLLIVLFLNFSIHSYFTSLKSLYSRSKWINAFTTRFAQSPTEHSSCKSSHLYSVQSSACFTLTLTLVPLLLSLSNAPTVSSRLNVTEVSFTQHAPFLWSLTNSENCVHEVRNGLESGKGCKRNGSQFCIM